MRTYIADPHTKNPDMVMNAHTDSTLFLNLFNVRKS
jgi:hypothetical protein